MSTQTQFQAPIFALGSIAVANATTIRVAYTSTPNRINPVAADDSLNPANYVLSGPNPRLVTSVTPGGDDVTVLLYLDGALTSGTWTLSVSNVESSGSPLGLPNTLSFNVAGFRATPLAPGSENDDAETVIRKHFNPAFTGPEWEAVIKAMSKGDKGNRDAARSVFDQLFKSTAGGKYLDKLAAEDGLVRPANLGMGDDLFRKLSIYLSTEKITEKSIWQVLEVFYGTDACRANITSPSFGPFAIADGQTLTLLFDEKRPVTVIFSNDDFAVPGQGTALEVAASITRAIQAAGLRAFATEFDSPSNGEKYVRIYAGALGNATSVRATGGTCVVLGFDTSRSPALPISVGPNTVDGVDIVIPVTTQAVNRTVYEASYLQDTKKLTLVSAMAFLGVFQVTTVEPHGLLPGSTVILDGFYMYGANAGRINGIYEVDPIFLGPNTFAVRLDGPVGGLYVVKGTEKITPLVSVQGSIPGPYLLDPQGVALTGVETVSTMDLSEGQGYSSLSVADASSFPDENGWLVVNLGRTDEIGPIPYFGKISKLALRLDFSFRMSTTAKSGATVTLLAQKGPWIPSSPEKIGAAYVTAANEGRAAATQLLTDTVAEGIDVNLIVKYPSDRGLGSEGEGSLGQKPSDIINAYGSDDLDADYAGARSA